MAISPKSKGLGNIGSIVNRQGMASPTRPMAKPAPKQAPKPVAKMPVPKPVTTTLAQRQASQPFKNYSKPAQPKINPLAQQQPNPLQQAMSPQQRTDLPPGAQMRKPMLGAQPQQRTDLPPGAQMRKPMLGAQPTTPPPQPFNPQPNPGQAPMGFGNPNSNYGGTPDPFMDPFMGGMYGGPDVMPPDYDPNQGMMPSMQDDRGMGGPGSMEYGVGQQFGIMNDEYRPSYGFNPPNPNPTTPSDYDELEGSAFNTNPSNGSMFGGGGFPGY